MNIGVKFDGPSFAVGLIAAAIQLGHLSPWWAVAVPILLLDLPGPRMSYKTGEGWSFKWWESRKA